MLKIYLRAIPLVLAFLFPAQRLLAQQIDVDLQPRSIPPNYPAVISIHVGSDRPSDAVEHVCGLSGAYVHAQVLDLQGNAAGVPRSLAWYSQIPTIQEGMFSNTQRFACAFPLDLWCATELPPGSYSVQITLDSLNVAKNGERVIPTLHFEPARAWRIPLEILPNDSESVTRAFAELFERLKKRAVEGPIGPMDIAMRCDVNALVHSQAPEALPFQLKLFEGVLPMQQGALEVEHLWKLSQYFVEVPRIDVLKHFIAWLEKPPSAGINAAQASRVQEIVLWTVVQMHHSGGLEMAALSKDIAAKHPHLKDPIPPQGIEH